MNSHTQCSSRQPVSWLTLELFALGELPGHEINEVQQHLDHCEACRGCLEVIRQDQPELPPLPALEALTAPNEAAAKPVRRWWRLSWIPALITASAALLLLLLPPPDDAPLPHHPPRRVAIKGGELSLTLVRKRGHSTLRQPRTHKPGDRFKVEVSCPPGQLLHWDVVVFSGAEASYPLTPGGPLPCGNNEPLPGAFGLTGEHPAVVCVVVNAAGPVGRRALSRQGLTALPASAVCEALTLAR